MTLVPDRAGWWWRGDCQHPVLVYSGRIGGPHGLQYHPEGSIQFPRKVTDDGHWQGPSCIRPSVPLPAPKAGGREVTPGLVANLLEHGFDDAAQLVLERDAYGRGKYGQGLMTDDGRDKIEDARQEFGDLLQYVAGAKMEGRDLAPLRALVPALLHVLGGG